MVPKKISIEKSIVVAAIFIAGLCSIIYELLISTTSSYFLGDSIKQFSLTIGFYMASMGIGAFGSKFISKNLVQSFVWVEVVLGIIGGLSVPILYYSFEHTSHFEYSLLMIGLTVAIGILTGLEIPILVRMMKKHYPLKVNLANVLSVDYLGALIATLLFPFLLLPFLGIFRTGIFFGLINVLLGVVVWQFFSKQLHLKNSMTLYAVSLFVLLAFGGLIYFTKPILAKWDNDAFTHRVIFSKQTPYQHLILTKNKDDLRLYINRIIQFSSLDEYRYHESLGLIPLNAAPFKKKVLVLGGGEGLLVRELLKESKIEEITIVDLDIEMFNLARTNPYLKKLNQGVLDHPKVKLEVNDAATFLSESDDLYDIILADLPDPSNQEVARLYSTFFFKLIQKRLSRFGIFATQATGTFHTNKAFWCIHETIKSSNFQYTYPFHAYIPSFGDWGFVMAANQPIEIQKLTIPYETKFLNSNSIPELFTFEKDIQLKDSLAINKLDQPALLNYYLQDWRKWSKEKIK